MLDISNYVCYTNNVKVALHLGGAYLENNIRALRKNKKITQDDLADAVGVTRQTIISIESGKYNASLQLAFKIAGYFGVKIEDVFMYKED